MSDFDYQSFLETLPEKPGVYKMHCSSGELLYVGKANSLKKRVSSYFKKNVQGKTKHLVKQIDSISFIVTTNETEALLLEANLIKTQKPKYNVLLRDDKSYPYILLSKDDYPRLSLYRGKKTLKNEGRLYGPFPSGSSVRETIDLLIKHFKLRTCKNSYFKNRSRPCLEYQINRCSGPCVKKIEKEQYLSDVAQVALFLSGKTEPLFKQLENSMLEASDKMDYELASQYRDKISALSMLLKQQVVSSQRGDCEVVGIAFDNGLLMSSVIIIQEGKVLSSNSFQLDYPEKALSENELLEPYQLLDEATYAFLVQFYLSTERTLPREVIVPVFTDSASLIASLNERYPSVKFRSALRGQDKKRHLLALENAKASIEVTQKDFELINTRLTLLQEALGLKRPIKRIECFDISHSMGEHTIASCVVFSDNGAEKKAYRTFLIKDIAKGDDYAAMAQVLTRRLNSLLEKDEVSLPDVILIDGGKGQLNVAKQVLESLQINEVILLAVSKGPSRKSGDEQLLLAESTVPLTLAINSPARHLIQFVRDESHRFAITAHRRKRGKKMSYSQLREIEGIGEKKQQQLIKRFLSINGIKKASIDEIANLSGFSRTLAKKIKEALAE